MIRTSEIRAWTAIISVFFFCTVSSLLLFRSVSFRPLQCLLNYPLSLISFTLLSVFLQTILFLLKSVVLQEERLQQGTQSGAWSMVESLMLIIWGCVLSTLSLCHAVVDSLQAVVLGWRSSLSLYPCLDVSSRSAQHKSDMANVRSKTGSSRISGNSLKMIPFTVTQQKVRNRKSGQRSHSVRSADPG